MAHKCENRRQMTTTVLEELIGRTGAAIWLNEVVDGFVTDDMLDAARALDWVRARAAAGELPVLAAPGQTWQRCPDASIGGDRAKLADKLTILHRLAAPPRLIARADHVAAGIVSILDLPLDVLYAYTLVSWNLSPLRRRGIGR